MSDKPYRYEIADCDVDVTTRRKIAVYREFWDACQERIRGEADSSIASQMHELAWHTVVFKTLNEARRLEENREVNGPMWHLIVSGYANIMTLGIRKLVDHDAKTGSVWSLIQKIENHPDLLTRELYVCNDGLPYDYESVRERLRSQDDVRPGTVWRMSALGPDAWPSSQRMHETFDGLCGQPQKRSKRPPDTLLLIRPSPASSAIG